MVAKLLSFAGAIAGAVGLSQFPEFSQQYLQRLAGQADALRTVVEDFDRSAASAGLDRPAALAALGSEGFAGLHADDMARTFDRYDRLEQDLVLLRAAGPLERIGMPQRFRDTETLQATWADFEPAVPATPEGLTTAGAGFVAGWAAVAGLLSLLGAPFRSRGSTRRV